MAPPRSPDTQMLARGIGCIVIGAAVLIAPHYLQSPVYRDMVAGAHLVGWFALALGVALVVVDRIGHFRKR